MPPLSVAWAGFVFAEARRKQKRRLREDRLKLGLTAVTGRVISKSVLRIPAASHGLAQPMPCARRQRTKTGPFSRVAYCGQKGAKTTQSAPLRQALSPIKTSPE